MKRIAILGFGGTLRRGSYSSALLKAASELVPDEATFEIFGLEGFPPFNQDLENAMPARAIQFKSKIRSADALMIVTAEYNYSIPGFLKNAIDWASRPYGDNSFKGKPLALMSSSIGMLGGARAQYHLRQACVFLDMHPVNSPEVFIANAAEKFDRDGSLVDETAKGLIVELLKNLVSWTRLLESQKVTGR